MRIPISKKNFTLVFLSFSIIGALWVLENLFLENYESLINYFYLDFAKENSNVPKLADLNFLFSYIIIYFQKITLNFNFFILHKLLTIWIIIALFIKLLFEYKVNIFKVILFSSIFIFLNIDSFIFIHTNKLFVLLLIFGLIYALKLSHHIKSYVIVLFVALYAIAMRVDLTFMLSLFILFISVVYKPKKTFFKASLLVVVAFIGMLFLILKINSNADSLKDFYTVERAIQDRMDFVLDKPSEDTTLNKQEMIMYGMGMFLLDKEVQKNIPYASLVKHSSLKEYIFSNPNFINIYFNKLNNLWEHLKTRYFINFFLSLISVFFIGFFHWKLKIPSWKFGVALLAYIGLPLAINTIAIINISFFSVYLLIPFFAVYVLCLKHYSNTKRLSILHLFLFFVALSNFYFFILPEIKNFKEMEANKLLVMEAFKEDNKNGNTPVVTYIDYDYFLPSNIKFNYKDIDFVFLDAGAYNTLEHFKKMHFKNFGENYTSFLTRFEKAVATNGYLYSSKSTFEFMILYLKRVHDIDVRFQPVEKFGDIDFYKYEINAIAKIN